MSLNTTNLKQKRGGRTIKQADRSSTFLFVLQDGQGREINLDGKKAQVSLHNPNNGRYWENDTTVKGSEVEFNLPGNLANDDYILEIASDGYVFPSDNDLIITVTKGYARLLGKETAERTRLTFEEIRKEVEEEAKADLDKQIVKIRGEKDSALEEIDNQAQARISDLKTHITDGKNQVNKARDEAINKVNSTRDAYLSDLDNKTQDGLKKIGDKSSSTLSTIDSKKNETLEGLDNTRKTFETNIDGALTQAIKDIPYEKLKGEKGDSPRIVGNSISGLTRTYQFDTTDTITVKDGRDGKDGVDGTVNIAEMTESQLEDVRRQLDTPEKSYVDKKLDEILQNSLTYQGNDIVKYQIIEEAGKLYYVSDNLGSVIENDFLKVPVKGSSIDFKLKGKDKGIVLLYSLTDEDLRYAIHTTGTYRDYHIDFVKTIDEELILTTVTEPEDRFEFLKEGL